MSQPAPLEGEGPGARLSLLLPVAIIVLATAVTATGAGQNTVWYFIRASGIVAYLLLTVTMVAGLLLSSRSLPVGPFRVDGFEVHNLGSLLVLGFGGFHAVALLLDSYVGFTARQILIPLTSDYRPAAVSLGILTLYLSIAIYVSFWSRRWIGQRAWRVFHYSSFLAFIFATYHGILSGADTHTTWMLAIYFGSMALVLGLVIYRVITSEARSQAARQAVPETSARSATPPWARGFPPNR